MIAEISGLGALGLLVSIHFAYSVLTARRITRQYYEQTQMVQHLGNTSVAQGYKPRVVGR